MAPDAAQRLARNDPRQYDGLVEQWWNPAGPLAMLHWLAAARADLLPPAPTAGDVLLDLGCGGGLLAPHVTQRGYRHVGIDLNEQGLQVASLHGTTPVCADVLVLPLADACADTVVAGEIFEHVRDPDALVAEICRVLRPGGLVVLDTLAATRRARLMAVTLAERIPGGPPRGIHDPALLIDRLRLVREFARHGVPLRLQGLRLPLVAYTRWVLTRGRGDNVPTVRLRPSRSTAVMFRASGRKVRS